jgi:hypothetical protein
VSRARVGRALGAAIALALAGCVPVLGDYTLSEATSGAPCREETQAVDCPAGHACYADAVCLKTCNDAWQCGAFHECGAGFCSLDVGADCDASRRCGAGYCVDRDAAGSAVPRYCTIFCDGYGSGSGGAPASPCPTGYGCVDNNCLRL